MSRLATSTPRVTVQCLPTLRLNLKSYRYPRRISTNSASDLWRPTYLKICLQSLQQGYSRIALCVPSAGAAALDLLSSIPPPSLIPTATNSVIVSNSLQEAKTTQLLLATLYPKTTSEVIEPDYDDLASLRMDSNFTILVADMHRRLDIIPDRAKAILLMSNHAMDWSLDFEDSLRNFGRMGRNIPIIASAPSITNTVQTFFERSIEHHDESHASVVTTCVRLPHPHPQRVLTFKSILAADVSGDNPLQDTGGNPPSPLQDKDTEVAVAPQAIYNLMVDLWCNRKGQRNPNHTNVITHTPTHAPTLALARAFADRGLAHMIPRDIRCEFPDSKTELSDGEGPLVFENQSQTGREERERDPTPTGCLLIPSHSISPKSVSVSKSESELISYIQRLTSDSDSLDAQEQADSEDGQDQQSTRTITIIEYIGHEREHERVAFGLGLGELRKAVGMGMGCDPTGNRTGTGSGTGTGIKPLRRTAAAATSSAGAGAGEKPRRPKSKLQIDPRIHNTILNELPKHRGAFGLTPMQIARFLEGGGRG